MRVDELHRQPEASSRTVFLLAGEPLRERAERWILELCRLECHNAELPGRTLPALQDRNNVTVFKLLKAKRGREVDCNALPGSDHAPDVALVGKEKDLFPFEGQARGAVAKKHGSACATGHRMQQSGVGNEFFGGSNEGTCLVPSSYLLIRNKFLNFL